MTPHDSQRDQTCGTVRQISQGIVITSIIIGRQKLIIDEITVGVNVTAELILENNEYIYT